MITRIVLHNFMAHEHAAFDLGPGLTVLTGPNNTGKSAVVEALRCVAENPAPKHHIRHGAKEARVEVHLEEGRRVVWVRTRTHPRYEIWEPGAEEPEVYAKTGGKVPEDVQALLRMEQVHLEESNRRIDVHLGNQREPIFLLNQPGSAFAQFFAASTEGAHLLAMQDALKDKALNARRLRDDSARRISGIEAGLDALAPLPEIEMLRQKAEASLEEFSRSEAVVPVLNAHIQTMRGLRAKADTLRKSGSVLGKLAPPVTLIPVTALARLWMNRTTLGRSVDLAARRSEALAPLREAPELFPSEKLARLVSRMQEGLKVQGLLLSRQKKLQPLVAAPQLAATVPLARVIEIQARLRAQTAEAERSGKLLEKLEASPEVFPAQTLEETIRKLQSSQRAMEKIKENGQILGRVVEPPQPENLDFLKQRLKDIRTLKDDIGKLRQESEKRGRELEEFRAGLDARLKELGCCPLCGAALDAGSFLEKGHVHG